MNLENILMHLKQFKTTVNLWESDSARKKVNEKKQSQSNYLKGYKLLKNTFHLRASLHKVVYNAELFVKKYVMIKQ